MISVPIDIFNFLFKNFSFLSSLIILTILAITLSKSIKKNAKVYYWVCGVISAMFIIPMLGRMTGLYTLNLFGVPIIGNIIAEMSSMAYMGHPLLVIIMYMGALSLKTKYVPQLMSIRKELSIIVGFPVLAHTMKRIFGTFIHAFGFFTDREAYMEGPRNVSELAAGIGSVVYILGVVMFVLFLVLWITSFDGVHRKMGSKKWKATQKWSYALYAMLFIHAFGMQLSSYINECAKVDQGVLTAQVEAVAPDHGQRPETNNRPANEHAVEGKKQEEGHTSTSRSANENNQRPTANQKDSSAEAGAHAKQEQGAKGKDNKKGGHPKRFSLADIELDRKVSSLIKMLILIGVYGSYLFLRLRKAKKDKARKA